MKIKKKFDLVCRGTDCWIFHLSEKDKYAAYMWNYIVV